MDARQGLQHLLYGRYQISIGRKVTDEEVVNIIAYFRRPKRMQAELRRILEELRDHMLEYNKQVVLAHQDEIRRLNRQIADLQGELSDLNAKAEQRRVARIK